MSKLSSTTKSPAAFNADDLTPSLAIYDDRMVFQNPGAFPPGMNWTDFVDDSIGSMSLNPTIANVFYRRGTIESWGSSISLLIHSSREQGLPEPKIDIVPNFVNLTIWFKDLLSTQDPTGLHKTAKSDLTETERQIVDFFQVPRTIGTDSSFRWMRNR